MAGGRSSGKSSPAVVRATLFRYRFTTAEERRQTGAWWVRTPAGPYLPPLRLNPASEREP